MSQNLIGKSLLYVGTYTLKEAKGIYLFLFDESTGSLQPLGLVAAMPNPTFLRIHPGGRFLYAVSEVRESGGRQNGSVNAFAVNRATGGLTFINSQLSGGAGPCHLSVDRTGRVVMAANYASGSVVALPIKSDGSLGEATEIIQHHGASVNPERQSGPHAHSITPSPDNRFALAADLGLDRIMIYRMDVATGRLQPGNPAWVAVKPGAGPRHLAFHPIHPLVYVINELDNTVITFAWDAAQGTLRELQTASTLPSGFSGASSTAEVQTDRSGRFLYGSNRGHDSIAIFRINEPAGTLSPLAHQPCMGNHPRHFTIHSSGNWLLVANQDSDSIIVFRRNPATGQLVPTSHSATVSMPACLLEVCFQGTA
ncbi:MAG: lactonase family protein [bacterium]